jgi:hypothetical protein
MDNEFDISGIPVDGQPQVAPKPVEDPGTSVLSPNYRPRSAFGGQQLGGAIVGIPGTAFGPVGSAAGSFVGGAAGEAVEQIVRDEPFSLKRVGMAGLEEAVWDAGGNLVLKGLGKTLRFGGDILGFSKKDIPDPNKAAQTFLEKHGSSLPASARTGSNFDATLEGLVNTPATADLFKNKQQEIANALQAGQKDVLKKFAASPEFEQALRNNSSAQIASGQVFQNFIKDGEKALSDSVDPIYTRIFSSAPKSNLIETTTGGAPQVNMFSIKNWANSELKNPQALTAGQRSILNEMKALPPTVDFFTLHKMRSRWLAENRDKYASMGSEKDSRASGTISGVIKQFDDALDFSAGKTLPPELLKEYRTVTESYRKSIQSFQSDTINAAMIKRPEEVGSYLFANGNETTIKDVYKALATAGNLNKKSSAEIMNALRVGYLDALTGTPENMLKFSKDLEQNKAMQNTFNVLFGGTPQKEAIEAMNNAAKLGLIAPSREAGFNMATAGAMKSLAGAAALYGSGYIILLNPEQQQQAKDNLPGVLVTAGGLLLSQRNLAKLLLDPKGAKSLKFVATAKDKLSSPTAFTKLVIEPMNNILNTPMSFEQNPFQIKSEYDISNLPIK